MDSLLLHCPSTAKRPCCSPPKVSNLEPFDQLLESFLSLSDVSSNLSLDLAFDRIIESKGSDPEKKDNMIERAMRLGSALLEAGKRSQRNLATLHNSVAWSLPADLTIKIFSMLDTQSVCFAAATFSFFRKCAEDPLCYADLDLVTESPKVNNIVVSTMIHRAGKVLRSLRLGVVPCPSGTAAGGSQPLKFTIRNPADASGLSWTDKRSRQGKGSCILTRSCLSSLSGGTAAPGTLLRRLHLYNIERVDNSALDVALSACSSLHDLEIVGLHVELRQTLEYVSKYCHLIEHLHFESSRTGRDDSLKLSTCSDFVSKCPQLTSLALKGFKLHDSKVRTLVKGFRRLKYVDFSMSYSITGSFLRSLGSSAGGNLLEVLILRDCMHLKEVEVSQFLTAVIGGDFKLLRLLDISNREGLAAENDWYNRCYDPSWIPFKQLREQRPGLHLLAEFPAEGSFDIDQMTSSDSFSYFGSPFETSQTSDEIMPGRSSESSYNSDQGSSGNEDGRGPHHVIFEESSDEVDFLTDLLTR